ncbi:regulatory protein RecX [Paramicrobacterium agarici]|uniref:Regulatory protein RecX n=1 Tax=Paramicrobacterium agarici TaxID=630514 RepID=A0A2A9DWT3_9MICO|nr:regulatory protein RecX [Microbacterium agarici]PFG31044.1 regulatory protein [Microbacterium agarici]
MVSFQPTEDDERDVAPVTDLNRHRRARGRPEPDPAADDASPALADLEAAVVRAIGRRGLTEKEVRDRVIEKSGDDDQARAVVERMRELRYVDDARIAEEMVHRLSDGRGKSRAVVAREMSARGISREVADAALDDISDDSERSRAIELAVKRGAQLGSLDDAAFDRRLTGYLARRGYSGAIVREAVAAARAERRSSVRFR